MRTRSFVKPVAAVAAFGLLVAVAVVGTRALSGVQLDAQPLRPFSIGAFEVVLLVAAVLCLPLLVVSMVLNRQARRAAPRGEFEWLQRLVFLAVLIGSVLVLQQLLFSADDEGPGADSGTVDSGAGPAEALWSGWTAALAGALAVGALAVMWWRRHAAPAANPRRDRSDIGTDSAAARAGRVVLDRQWDDPRAAVVGCYAAMESVLADAGSARRRAETPEELLDRTVAEGRLAPGPGKRLTELFLTARYSSAVVTSGDVAAARQALRTVEEAGTS